MLLNRVWYILVTLKMFPNFLRMVMENRALHHNIRKHPEIKLTTLGTSETNSLMFLIVSSI